MIFSLALQGLRDRMTTAGCQAQLLTNGAQSSFRVPAPSWMDDLAIPLVVPSASQVVPQAACVVEAVAQELHEMGVSINLGRGKSELLPFFAGPCHRKERLRWICHEEATFPVRLPNRHDGVMHIVPSYVHLGSVVDVSAGDTEDITRRRFLARDLLRSQLKLLRNPHLTSIEKVNLLLAGPVARFQHGSGLWALSNPSERAAFHAGYMELIRKAFRPITGVSTKGMSDEEVCSGLGVLSSSEVRVVQLCRHAAWLQAEHSEAIFELWFQTRAWLDEVRQALAVCAKAAGGDFDASEGNIPSVVVQAKHWTKAFIRCRLKERRSTQNQVLQQWTGFAKAAELGWIFLCFRQEQAEQKSLI